MLPVLQEETLLLGQLTAAPTRAVVEEDSFMQVETHIQEQHLGALRLSIQTDLSEVNQTELILPSAQQVHLHPLAIHMVVLAEEEAGGTLVVVVVDIAEGRAVLSQTDVQGLEADPMTRPILQAATLQRNTPRGTQRFLGQLQARILLATTQATASSTLCQCA